MSLLASRSKGRGPVEEARVQGRLKEVECGPTSWWGRMEAEKMSQERAEEAKGGVGRLPLRKGAGSFKGQRWPQRSRRTVEVHGASNSVAARSYRA